MNKTAVIDGHMYIVMQRTEPCAETQYKNGLMAVMFALFYHHDTTRGEPVTGKQTENDETIHSNAKVRFQHYQIEVTPISFPIAHSRLKHTYLLHGDHSVWGTLTVLYAWRSAYIMRNNVLHLINRARCATSLEMTAVDYRRDH
jgi:hypothetical protein